MLVPINASLLIASTSENIDHVQLNLYNRIKHNMFIGEIQWPEMKLSLCKCLLLTNSVN